MGIHPYRRGKLFSCPGKQRNSQVKRTVSVQTLESHKAPKEQTLTGESLRLTDRAREY